MVRLKMKGRNSIISLCFLFYLFQRVQKTRCQRGKDLLNPAWTSGCLPIFQEKILDDLHSTPRCNVSFLKGTENPPCFKRGTNVFQIRGHFSGLTLNCTAPYLVNLDFDGFRPTEALSVFLWRDVVEVTDEARVNNTYGIKVRSFGLTATVTSIQSLFEQYKLIAQENERRKRPLSLLHKNLTTPIIYPRTGRIRIHGMKDEHRMQFQDFYFFFEEPLLGDEITFMDNQHTLKPVYKKLETTSNKGSKVNEVSPFILIPCRPSHWTSNVTLRFRNSSSTVSSSNSWSLVDGMTSTLTFDPTVGYKIPAQIFNITSAAALKNSQLHFKCSVSSSGGKIAIWEANSKADAMPFVGGVPIFGAHMLPKLNPNPEERQPMSISFNQFSFEGRRMYTSIECSFDHAQPNATLLVFAHERQQSYVELNFNREFALPVFVNRSYFVLKGTAHSDIDVESTEEHGVYGLQLEQTLGAGVAFCSNLDNFEFIEMFRNYFTDPKYYFPAGTCQHNLTFHSVPDPVLIRLDREGSKIRGETIYTHETVDFVCNTLSGFTLNRNPILWFFENSEGIRRLIFKDDFVSDDPLRVNDNSRLKIQLTSNVSKVICMGALWQTDEWRHSALPVNVTDGAPPSFIGSQRTLNFQRGSLNQTISCVTDGDPIPQVWWEKDGVKLTRAGSKTAVYKIPEVDEASLGKYKCIAENPYEKIEAEFLVQSREENHLFYLLAVGLPFLVIFVLLVVAGVVFARARLRKEILSAEELKEFREGVDATKFNEDKDSPAMVLGYGEDFEIPPGKFSIHRNAILGSGEFGMVMKATVKNRKVAVKTVRPDSDKMHLKALIMELKILMYLEKHAHLIEFVGAYTKNIHRGHLYVFVELCEGGNLLTFLQNHAKKFPIGNPIGNQNYENILHTVDTLHGWALEIAKGMQYLGSKRVIHGDLAARNILLSADLTAKITDFGLSRQLMSYSMYMKKSEEPLPFRWMSVESLESLKFSCESDVWSYGVLLWEIYSLGQVPFPNLNWDIEFVERLRKGLRMSCPHMISEELFASLLCPCWENEPKSRPSFLSICAILENLNLNGKIPPGI